MKPKVLIIPENFPTDHNPVAGIFMKDQIRAIQPYADITVFNSNPWYRGVYDSIDGVKTYDFHLYAKKPSTLFKPLAYAWWASRSISMARKLKRPDIIHLHGASMRGSWVSKLAAEWNIPFVITEHTGPWSAISDRQLIFKAVSKSFHKAAGVWPVSNHLKIEMIDSGITDKLSPLGNPVDTDLFSPRATPLASTKRVLFVGRLDPFKGGLKTLKAFHQLEKDGFEFTLTIAGDGVEADAIQAYIDEHKLENKVFFLRGKLDRTEMRNLFHESSFLVFPSEFESFGLVGAEAMATGLPVVLSDRTGPLDYSTPENSIQVDPFSIDSIAQGINEMARRLDAFHPEQIRKEIVSKFGFDVYGREVSRRYREILSSTGDSKTIRK